MLANHCFHSVDHQLKTKCLSSDLEVKGSQKFGNKVNNRFEYSNGADK